MADQPDVTFCLMVPSGTWALSPLVEAIHTYHPGAAVVAVWCGDPHLRPTLDRGAGVTWADLALPDVDGIGWGLLLCALDARPYEWLRTAASVRRMLDVGAGRVVVLRVGTTAMGAASSLLVSDSSAVTLVRRIAGALPADGLAPAEVDLDVHGTHSTSLAAFGPAARKALDWLIDQLVSGLDNVGRAFDRLAQLFDVTVAGDDVCVAGWAEPTGVPFAVVDLEALDPDEPWHFTFGSSPARVRLSSHRVFAEALADVGSQRVGAAEPVALPGGLPVDAAMRRVVSAAIERWRAGADHLPPEPFGPNNAAFMRWLAGTDPWAADVGRYWLAVREQRADLLTVFAKPQSNEAERFIEWIDAAWRLEAGQSVLVPASNSTRPPIGDAGHEPFGFNVLGYFDFDQSQGHIARELVVALSAAGVPTTPLNHHRSQGSVRAQPISSPRKARFATNLVVVNPDQFEFVVADHGATLLEGRRTIGYWFWELEDVPDSFQLAIDHVDEIWTGSQFIADAFARVTDKPVHCVPLPIARPEPSKRGRDTMGVPADAYVFLTTFDQFSVPERKNPFGVIEAFTRAFADGEGPVLLVKTMNGSKGWRNHERLLLAAAGRSDIVVWDEHLSRPDQMAVLAAADCLVSLHRSEGLGLHCAEAMWLGKPVIATRYSGNLDFMDDSVAAMIDYELTAVTHGEGIYPETAHWADPDLDQAAEWMRRLVVDSAIGRHLGTLARARMEHQPSMAETGRRIAELAGLRPAETPQHDAHGGS